MNAVVQGITWKRLPAFASLYLLFSAVAIYFIHAPGHFSLFWPASGIAFAFLVRYGLTWAIPLAAVLALMHWSIDPAPPLFLLLSISGNVIGAIVAALYVRTYDIDRYQPLRSGFISLQAAILMAFTSALIGVAGLCLSGMNNFDTFWPGVAKWGMGDLLGIVCTAPVLLLLTAPASRSPDSPRSADYAAANGKLIWAMLLVLSYALIFIGGTSESPYALGLTCLPIALLVWSAIRFQPIWTMAGIALTVLVITTLTGLGMAGFMQPRGMADATFLLGFLCMIAIFPLVLLASNHESRTSTRKIIRRATTDRETGLPNRMAFEDAARLVLGGSGPTQTLAYLDFDHFNLVNDTASHEAGDELIKGIASMTAANLSPGDRIFRIGGDEFALLLLCEGREAELRAQRVLRAIETYKAGWGGHVLSTTASIGLAALKPGHGDFAQLLSQADAACFTAKELGGNRICVAGQESAALRDRTEAMQAAILTRQALNGDYFELYCQDILPLADNPGNGRYFELLLRLRDPQSGELLNPKSFIPAAERFHLGVKIDRYVINMLLSWMESHPKEAETVSACSINLSGVSMDDEDFSGFLENRLKESSFPADKIIFEITETCAMHDLSRAQALIHNLRGIGCRFALDDFGTGFCSFSYMQNLDVDIFKIDGSFVRDLQTSQFSSAVIRSITDIAHVLKKKVTAEHCESLELIGMLRKLGVDHAQGYGIHKPQAIAEYFSRQSLIMER